MMNVPTVILDPSLSSIEEQEQDCVESDVVDEIINCVKSIKQTIALNKEALRH
jgi:hypothetical protein